MGGVWGWGAVGVGNGVVGGGRKEDGVELGGEGAKGGDPPHKKMSGIPNIFLSRHPTTRHLKKIPTQRQESIFCLQVNDALPQIVTQMPSTAYWWQNQKGSLTSKKLETFFFAF